MLINTIANHLRQSKGDNLTIEQLRAELRECESVKRKTTQMKLHIATLRSYINAKAKQ
jgi:hypothetical protein